MINRIVDILKGQGQSAPPQGPEHTDPYDQLLAVCALFVEMAGIDGEFSSEEHDRITSILTSEYELDSEDVEQVIATARERMRTSMDYWHLTNIINRNYAEEQKVRIVELLWKIIYADGSVDVHEDYLVHKLSRLLGLKHRQMIDAKIRMKP
jgi:uncharacterized tellurite resistance protein B-like protein